MVLDSRALAPTALDLLRLLAASAKFPDGAHVSMALDPLHLPPPSSEFTGVLGASLQA